MQVPSSWSHSFARNLCSPASSQAMCISKDPNHVLIIHQASIERMQCHELHRAVYSLPCPALALPSTSVSAFFGGYATLPNVGAVPPNTC